jgi:hypothetical protein
MAKFSPLSMDSDYEPAALIGFSTCDNTESAVVRSTLDTNVHVSTPHDLIFVDRTDGNKCSMATHASTSQTSTLTPSSGPLENQRQIEE